MFRAEHTTQACHFDRTAGFAQELQAKVKKGKQEGRKSQISVLPAFLLSLELLV
jgi:hypothetical protein